MPVVLTLMMVVVKVPVLIPVPCHSERSRGLDFRPSRHKFYLGRIHLASYFLLRFLKEDHRVIALLLFPFSGSAVQRILNVARLVKFLINAITSVSSAFWTDKQ